MLNNGDFGLILLSDLIKRMRINNNLKTKQMKKNVSKALFFAPFMLMGFAASAQSNQTTEVNAPNVFTKEAHAPADPAVLAKHLETSTTPVVVAEPISATTSTVIEVDYNRLQAMPEAQRLEILGDSKKYKVINQPK